MLKFLSRLAVAIALLCTVPAIALSSESEMTVPEEPSSGALAFVEKFSDRHLSGMLSKIGARQPQLIAASQVQGDLLAIAFDLQIDEAVKAHGDAWKTNMARAWTGLMTSEELQSLATEGADSPYTEKYLSLRNEAGQRMQAISDELFREILASTINATLLALKSDAEPAGEPEKKTE